MIKIYKANREILFDSFVFPGGEVGVKINMVFPVEEKFQTVVARIQNSKDVMELVMVVDALRRLDKTPIRLFMPYVPYGRQDRVCNPGEAHSLYAFAQVINSLNFESVTVVDPHSDVIGAVFNNIKIIYQLDVINNYPAFRDFVLQNEAIFIAPDAGANKKISTLASYFNHRDFIRADKLRDLSNGKIKETIVYADRLNGQTVVIADDICDGGASFTALAKVLKDKGAAKVVLYVTHGIFSKGEEVLYKSGIDTIFTTNSWTTSTGSLNALNLEKTFLGV